MEKHCRTLQAADNNMAHAYCMLETKATNTHSEYFLHFNNGCTDAPQYYLTRTLRVLCAVLTVNSGYFLKLVGLYNAQGKMFPLH